MKKILSTIQKHYDYILIFVFLFIYYLPKTFYNCVQYKELIFDSQNFIVWDYAKSIGVTPFKDIFFPYGFFYYYKDSSVFFTLLYFFLILFLFVITYKAIKYFWKNIFFSFILFILFFLFIEHITGVETYARYGIAVAGTLLFTLLSVKQKIIRGRLMFFSGICVSVCLSLIPDQGMYLLFVIPIVATIYTFLIRKQIGDRYMVIFSLVFFYCLGLVLGILPLIAYTLKTNIFTSYISHFYLLLNIADYAKAPYTTTLKSRDEIFILISLLLSFGGSVYLYKKFKKPEKALVIFALFFLLIALEQKSIMRSISTSLTFISFLQIILLVSIFFSSKTVKGVTGIVKMLSACILLYVLIFYLGLTPVYKMKKHGSQCNNYYNFSYLNSQKKYKRVVSAVKTDAETNPKVYSFPNDPIFYILFSQKPPYFLNIYDASSQSSQERQISYIKKMRINYVIYNLSTYSTQDGVPDIVRGNYLLRYILSNFSYLKTVENFLIFKKNILKSDFSENDKVYRYFSAIDLGHIPYTEGIHKKSDVGSVNFSSLKTFNEKLLKDPLDSNNIALLVSQKVKTGAKTKISLWSSDRVAQVEFKECIYPVMCIININRIPLFFHEKKLTHVTIEGELKVLISATDIKGKSIFW